MNTNPTLKAYYKQVDALYDIFAVFDAFLLIVEIYLVYRFVREKQMGKQPYLFSWVVIGMLIVSEGI